MPGFQSTRLVTEGTLEPFFFLYADDSIQGNPETCKQSSIMLNYEVKNRDPNSVSGINDAPSFTRGTIRDINRVDSEITVEISDEDASNFAGNRVLILECNPYVIGSEIFDISGCGNTKGKRDH